MQFRELTLEEFDKFVNEFNIHSIYQTIEYGNIMKNQNYDVLYLGLIENNLIIAASLILIKKDDGFHYAYAPRGYLLNYNNPNIVNLFSKNLQKYLGNKGIIGIKINPLIIKNIYNFKTQNINKTANYDFLFDTMIKLNYYHFGYNNYFEALKPRFEAIIDINKPIEKLYLNINKNYRTKIRSAIDKGVEIYEGTVNDLKYLYNFTKDNYNKNLEYFKDFYINFANKKNAAFYYTKLNTVNYLKSIQRKIALYEKEISKLNVQINKIPQNNKLINKKINISKLLNEYKKELINATNLLRKYPEGIITSCALIITQKDTVYLLIDGFDKKYKKLNSKHLLIWQIMTIYNKRGYKYFNLGGMSNITIDNSKYVGLDEFKLNFGALMYEYIGDFELIANKRNYTLYRNYFALKKIFKNKEEKN